MRTATYARYSSDSQREASIDDQLRAVGELCHRDGLPRPQEFVDQGISGERRDRPGYVALLAAAKSQQIDVIVLWDLKRLSRGEDLPQILAQLKFWGVRVITCDGFDSAQEGAEIRGWVDAMMGNRQNKDLAKATHRGLMGQALKGYSAGGLLYGYRIAACQDGNARAIDEDQACVVRRIFAEYVDGRSPREIAAGLNRDGVPAPRGPEWRMSAIYPDDRGMGILANSTYAGRVIWNRSRWGKDPETGKRTRQERPPSEWVHSEQPELRIVELDIFAAAERRTAQTRAKSQAIQAKLGRNARTGREPKYLFSGLLRCDECGGSMVIVDYYRYGCGTNKDRGDTACSNGVKVARKIVEQRLLAIVKKDLLSDEAYRSFELAARLLLKDAQNVPQRARQALAEASRERENIMAALRAGIITPSTKAALESAEARVDAAQLELRQAESIQPSQILPRARETWRRLVNAIEQIEDVKTAKGALRDLLGEIRVKPENGVLIATIGGETDSEIKMVAGAGFEPTTFGL
ncbi:recombinase family protein [Hydrocarboniphaga sp.]|uniref:recombinase family protein n=1 Tax=Hydrocarboniphaga sp. TaxID=2033016 RepID=UPI003D1313D2